MLGIVYIFVGAFVGIFGRRLFPYIASTAGGLLILDCIVYGSVIFGLTESNTGLILALVLGLFFSISFGYLSSRYLYMAIVLICII